MNEKLYKIRRDDGLFSTGSSNPKFNKKGKIWRRLRDLKCHLVYFIYNSKKVNIYQDCEIVELEMTEISKWPINLELNNMIRKREDVKKEFEEKYKKKIEQEEKIKLKELLKKYGDKDV